MSAFYCHRLFQCFYTFFIFSFVLIKIWTILFVYFHWFFDLYILFYIFWIKLIYFLDYRTKALNYLKSRMNKIDSGIFYYPPRMDKQQRISSKRLNTELFTRLVKELDICIDKAVERYFRDILERIRILIDQPCEG